MQFDKQFDKQFVREEEGQDVVEYGLLIVGIAFVVLLGVQAFGASLTTWFGNIATALLALPL
jgi:Flp pilus assembly pilin Flp